jgi:hypothetical protein
LQAECNNVASDVTRNGFDGVTGYGEPVTIASADTIGKDQRPEVPLQIINWQRVTSKIKTWQTWQFSGPK